MMQKCSLHIWVRCKECMIKHWYVTFMVSFDVTGKLHDCLSMSFLTELICSSQLDAASAKFFIRLIFYINQTGDVLNKHVALC